MLCRVGSTRFGSGYFLQVAGLFLFLTPCDGHSSNVYPCSFCASIDGSHIHRAEGGQAQWCVADPQAPADILQGALDWACGPGRADCSAIQGSRPCFLPNTPVAHASYAFNTYWQNNKHKGASCHFNAAAFITESNPSHDGCQFVFIQ